MWYVAISILLLMYLRRNPMPDDWVAFADSDINLIPAGSYDPTVINRVLSHKKDILKYAWGFKVDPALLSAIIHVESEGVASAIRTGSNDTYVGLMQLGVKTAKNLGYTGGAPGLTVPGTNLKYGATYLNYFNEKYNKRSRDVISAFNAGHSLCDGMVCKNSVYVSNVLNAVTAYRLTYGFLTDYKRFFPQWMYDPLYSM